MPAAGNRATRNPRPATTFLISAFRIPHSAFATHPLRSLCLCGKQKSLRSFAPSWKPSDPRPLTTAHRPPTTVLRPLSSGSRVPRSRAFTLIELMVAAGITTLLLLGMTGIFDQSMKAWRLSSRRADAEREVRAALSMIQRDFSSLIVQTNLPIYRVNNSANSSFITPGRTPEYSGSVACFFLTAPGNRFGSSGDVVGTGYYVAWDAGTRSYNLYRYFRSAPNQLTALTSFLGGNTPIATRTGLFPANAEADEVVGANVVNFRVEFKTLPALPFGPTTSQDGPVITNRPGYAQLELTAYGTEAVRSLSTSNQWVSTNTIQKFGRTYLWRVDL